MAGLTVSANIDTMAREIDFVTRFALNWQELQNIIGISRMIRKTPGTVLRSKYASVTLESGDVAEGGVIPYSEATVKTKEYGPINVEKYAKAVSIEAINEKGYADAVGLTDSQFLVELQSRVMEKFYRFVNSGSLVSAKVTFQAALAEAQGQVRNKWKTMHKGITDVVGFCNILDAYDYLGASNITVQTAFGMSYVENFIGYSKLFLCGDGEVSRGVVIATPVENIVGYYVSPDDSDFARAGLQYTTDGETNLIGFHVQGDYKTAVSESFALLGLLVLAEYVDGIAVVAMNDPNMTDATVAAATATDYWGTALTDIQANVTVANGKVKGTLKKLTTGQLVTDWGPGYFLALKFSNFSGGLTYSDVKVGLVPSEGAGYVTLDSDQDAVMKVTNKDTQKLAVIQDSGSGKRVQYFDLSELTLQ